MDQVKIKVVSDGKGKTTVYADPRTRGFHDLLVKGSAFYAVFDPDTNLWSQDLSRLSELIDRDIHDEVNRRGLDPADPHVIIRYMDSTSNGCWTKYCNSLRYLDDSKVALNQKMIFADETPKREDYATYKLDYSVKQGDTSSYDKLMSTIYSKEERDKLEWGIGALIDGKDIKKIQKMFVIYGDPGTGKSTVLEIIKRLFGPYCAQFNAEDLGKGYQFATAAFKNSPLIGLQMDGDLSHMWDNTLLNQIAAHEDIIVNEKGVKQYTIPLKTMLFMATNKPVKITDSKSGIVRRLIDIYPTGNTLPPDVYFNCMEHINFELGAIAYHCRELYRKLGMNYYSKYKPTQMIARTNDIYAFVQDNIDLMESEGIGLSDLWRAYKEWADESNVDVRMKRSEFSYEIGTYFNKIDRVKGKSVAYSGFKEDRFESRIVAGSGHIRHKPEWLNLSDANQSQFDKIASTYSAQYARNDDVGAPRYSWSKCTTKLKDLDTSKLHWVMVPQNHIVLDFDIRGDDGEKSLEKNIEAASKFPPTYAEVSKSGNGLHLHYIYDGDVNRLKNLYSTHIEIKVFKGNSSLRRKLTKCNTLNVAHISSGLPLKGEKSMINDHELKDEKHLRAIIAKCLQKKYTPGTKPSVEFIKKLMDEMYESGKPYDVSDLKNDILNFAMNSTHWSDYCVGLVANMKFQSEEPHSSEITKQSDPDVLTFFDTEVFPNLFMICFMKSDSDVVKTWINPSRKDVMTLLNENLVGFNNRKYDNHILWAWAVVGMNNEELYHLSQKIVSGSRDASYGQAFNVSYADIYDFAAKKQSLKKWEIELGIDHHELGMPWDQPVDPSKWPLVQSYCEDDVRATKAVFDHLKEDFTARKMLARLSGLSVNDTTNTHTAKIIFGSNKHPQNEFNFTDLSKTFPGYTFDKFAPKDQKSRYLGENPSEGGYVFVYGMKDGTYGYDYMNMKHPWDKE